MTRRQWLVLALVGAVWLTTLLYLIASTKGATCSTSYPC